MKLNFALPSWVRTALGVQGVEWDPVLLESVQPVVIVAGDVASPDGSGGSSAEGFAYAGFAFVNPAAGNNGHVQIWNPLDSGRDVYVDMVRYFTTNATLQASSLRTYATALTTLVGNANPVNLDATPSAAQVRTQANPAILGTEVVSAASPSAAQNIEIRPPVPYKLPPGWGLHAVMHSQPSNVFASFFIREVTRT